MSLWGEEFTIVAQPKQQQKKLIDKVSKPKQVTIQTEKVAKSKSISITEKLRIIRDEVMRILGVYKDQTVTIRTRDDLHKYIDAAIVNGEIAIDTETNNSLVPLTCKLMGPCIYTPGQKNAYIPINHVDPYSRELLPNQLTEQDIKEEFTRLVNTKIIMHNGKFDFEVIKCTCDIELEIYWDTMIASRILDENERANLKQQYISKIDPSIEKYSIEKLFDGIEYAVVDPDLFALYAATDAFMTYKLYLWQKAMFEIPGSERMYNLFKNIEMPLVKVCADMELTGITIDTEYASRLSKMYTGMLEDIDVQISTELDKYRDQIEQWRTTPDANRKDQKTNKKGEITWTKSKSEQLQDPPSMTSPTQLAIFLYDVLNVGVIDKKTPRGTGEEILKAIGLPICNLILEKRGLEKLIGTYVDKLPQCVLPETGRLHAHFNQIGADTGRFSSSDPNLQNIPSKNKNIRMMFCASPGNVLVGSDYSQQEPRLLASYANDEAMLDAYRNKKDLYATIAMGVYNNNYEDNLEHFPDGTKNSAGAARRSSCKSLLLGLMYGRGAASIAEQINKPLSEAQKIIDNFYNGYPRVKEWMDKTLEDARINGYVEDMWGRRRRLPDIQLPQFTVRYTDPDRNNTSGNFNPLLGATGKYVTNSTTKSPLDVYKEKALQCRGRQQVEKLKAEAKLAGIEIHDNGGFIAQAERQCVNSRVQGGASTITKCGMLAVHNDQMLKDLGFKLLVCVHDELIGECPEENQDAVANRLSELMIHAVEDVVVCPMKCDATITKRWYEDEISGDIKKNLGKLEEKMPHENAVIEVRKQYTYLTDDEFTYLLNADF